MAYPYYNNVQYQQYQQPNYAYQQQGQIQNGGFVSVRSIEEAYNYPIAPGNSVTFKVENAPLVCTKTMSFNQLDRPIFKKYRLVEEPDAQPTTAKNGDFSAEQQKSIDLSEYVKTSEFQAFAAKYGDIAEQLTRTIDRMKLDIDALSDKSTKKVVQKARKDADEE